MKQLNQKQAASKAEFYQDTNLQLEGLLSEEPDALANLANAASLLYWLMKDINWAGFYLLREGELVLGPFHGKPACTRIPLGKGVCGTAAQELRTVVVPDVHEFPGHIACDADSRSEIVVPIRHEGKLIGVLDIDSPIKERFDEKDAQGLDVIVATVNRYVSWKKLIE